MSTSNNTSNELSIGEASNDIDANIAMILNLPEVASAFARKNDQDGTDIDALKEELTNKMKDKFQADASSGIPIATTAAGLLVEAKEEARKVPFRHSKRRKKSVASAASAAAVAVDDDTSSVEEEAAIAAVDDKKKKKKGGKKKGGKKKGDRYNENYKNQSNKIFEYTEELDAVLSTGAVTVKVIRKLHASDFDKDECKQFLPDMNKRDCQDCGHANKVGRDPRQGYRLTNESLGSVANRKENLRLWANDTTDADGKPVYMPMVTDQREHERNKAANGDNPVVNQNNANTDETDGTILYKVVRLDPSKFPIKIQPPYLLIPASEPDQTDCNSLRLVTELDITNYRVEGGADENSAAVTALDNAFKNANIRRHEGVIKGVPKAFTISDHPHEARAYYHPDLQDYIAKGEAGFYQGSLRKLGDDE